MFKGNSQTAMYSNIVKKDILQLELASFQTIQKDDFEKSTVWSLPSALFRYGVHDRIELQLVTSFVRELIHSNNDLITSKRHVNKLKLGNKIIPETALTYRSIVPLNENDVIEKTGLLFLLNLSNKLANNLVLNYNFRYKIHSDKTTAAQYVSNLGYSLSNRFQIFIENICFHFSNWWS